MNFGKIFVRFVTFTVGTKGIKSDVMEIEDFDGFLEALGKVVVI